MFLVLVRLYFALSPSYLHPDENFQGPEVIAGMCDSVLAAFTVSAGLQKLQGSHQRIQNTATLLTALSCAPFPGDQHAHLLTFNVL